MVTASGDVNIILIKEVGGHMGPGLQRSHRWARVLGCLLLRLAAKSLGVYRSYQVGEMDQARKKPSRLAYLADHVIL